MKIFRTLFTLLLMLPLAMDAQDVNDLLNKLRVKLEKVNSYEAEGIMKTNVSFLEVPDALVKVYYKRPDHLKISNESGISLIPKSTAAISLNGMLSGKYTAIDAGSENLDGTRVKVIKLLPLDEQADVVLSTIYIDESRLLIIRAKTTTKDDGTYEVDLKYGKYSNYGLPDQVTCHFNTKDYKLPKGVTFDYDDGSRKPAKPGPANDKGLVEIRYRSYLINEPIPKGVF